jgi:GYF domain 2
MRHLALHPLGPFQGGREKEGFRGASSPRPNAHALRFARGLVRHRGHTLCIIRPFSGIVFADRRRRGLQNRQNVHSIEPTVARDAIMADTHWYYAVDGKQQGPFDEAQFRSMIERGQIGPDMLVWSASMPDWAKARDVPGLIPASTRPPSLPPSVPLQRPATVQTLQAANYPGGEPGEPLLTTAGPFALLGRALLVAIGQFVIIPSPWTNAMFYRWLVTTIELPNRKRVTFTGRGGDIWYIFMLGALCGLAGAIHFLIQLLLLPLTVLFYRIIVRWVFAHLVWEGQREPLQFVGGYWAFLGWQAFFLVSLISVIGWAWVSTAMLRWMCRNVIGSSKRLSFVGGGWGVLWRGFVLGITCIFIIPIPWMMRWYTRWIVSQFCLSDRI